MTGPAVSWGRYPRQHAARELYVYDRYQALPKVDSSMLAYGNGRSYGDSCLNGGATLLRTHGLNRLIEFDRRTGRLRCESGVLFDDLLRLIVPTGWFLPVLPGTRFVTVGGAIANDIHGKNHHRAGSFGLHLLRFELLRSDGQRLECTTQQHADLFAATIGGLGLTGLITWAELQLLPLASPWLTVETIRFRNLEEFFALSEESAFCCEHSVAWIDCLAPAGQRGRGVFSRANPCTGLAEGPERPRRSLRIPFTPPIPLIGGPGLRSFNRYWYYRSRPRRALQHYQPFLFPLDGIADWHRLYGPRGFLQYQCVLPPAFAATSIPTLLDAIADSGTGSFLAVLKRFGDLPSPGLLSFPRPGTTLALDFPFRGESTLALLERLDAIVAEAGGAVYPAKDARMSSANFRRFFPSWEEFSSHVDPKFSSSFWRRVSNAEGHGD